MIPEGIKKVAVLCVLKHQDKLLLLKRLKEPNKDSYTPLGGKLDPFETPLQAAVRETWEEAGIQVSSMDYYGILTETSPVNYNWISFVYVAEIDFIPPPPCNEGTLEWISFMELNDIPTPPTDRIIYEYIFANRKFAFNAVYNENLQMEYMDNDLTGERFTS